jgi:hypothetical protein
MHSNNMAEEGISRLPLFFLRNLFFPQTSRQTTLSVTPNNIQTHHNRTSNRPQNNA